jgi:hypothetical protein
MCLKENERKQLLYLQGYYLQSKELLNDLEKKLEDLRAPKESQTETLEQEG